MAIPLVADRVPHATFRTGVCSAYLHRAIAAGLCLTPLLAFAVDRGMIYPMVTGRNFAFRAFVELLLAAYIPLALSTPRYRPRASALLIAFAAFVAWIGVATLLSDDLSRSFWSTFERMGGYITLLHLFAFFVILPAVLDTSAWWQRLFEISVIVSLVVAIHVIFEFMAATDLGRVKGLLGNAQYVSAFLLFNVFLSLLLLVANLKEQQLSRRKFALVTIFLVTMLSLPFAVTHLGHIPGTALVTGILLLTGATGLVFAWLGDRTYFLAFLAVAFGIQIVGMLVTESRGPILGLIAGMGVAGLYWQDVLRSGLRRFGLRRLILFALAMCAALAISFLIVGLVPWMSAIPGIRRLAAISIADSTTAARLLLWSIAWHGVLVRPLIGWGPDNFDLVFDRFYNPAMFRATPLEIWYDSPHNVFMEWLVAGGLPGFLLIAALFILMARVFIGTDQLVRAARAIMLGLLTAYGFHCLVDLNDLHGSIHLVTIAAFANALTKRDALVGRGVQSISDRALMWMLPSALGLALAAAYVINAPGIANARDLFQAMTLGDPASGSVKPLAANLVQFDTVLAGAPLGRQEATQQLLEFAFFLGTRPEGSVDAQTLTSTYDAAHAAALRMIAERPHDARLEFRFGLFLNRFGQSDEAAQHLLRASLLAPSQQIILLELGINSYLRAHDSPAALPVLRRAFELEPRNIVARVAFALALHLGGQNTEAGRVLTEDIDAVSLEQRSRVLKSYRHAINRVELRLAWGARHPETQSALASLRSYVELSVPGPQNADH